MKGEKPQQRIKRRVNGGRFIFSISTGNYSKEHADLPPAPGTGEMNHISARRRMFLRLNIAGISDSGYFVSKPRACPRKSKKGFHFGLYANVRDVEFHFNHNARRRMFLRQNIVGIFGSGMHGQQASGLPAEIKKGISL